MVECNILNVDLKTFLGFKVNDRHLAENSLEFNLKAPPTSALWCDRQLAQNLLCCYLWGSPYIIHNPKAKPAKFNEENKEKRTIESFIGRREK
ncbi:CLUMA_CG009596, isoform A [Clunio marinus]|uniref:CLUMA_CG009596, isoform A n=1 Tax=Clunio marinus TaxID=568069 RepID=A0A1J1I775_9DIPT|nr:CLUMA_CG009596, isoform A [Clunio marinus]